jgi:pimeloyl-ACP methyl ester carboxylesterase
MKTFVLVHGAMHGGWCWRRVLPYLRAKGHDVFAPTLTGQGERAHLLTHQVGLATHVRDLASVLSYEDLEDVVLVAHSYAGMVASALAEEMRVRLAHIVYLDAYLPRDGESALDQEPSDGAALFQELARTRGTAGCCRPRSRCWSAGVCGLRRTGAGSAGSSPAARYAASPSPWRCPTTPPGRCRAPTSSA